MKKTLLLVVSSSFAFVAFDNLPGTMSAGAPAESTGAPNEKHCASSGCHSDFPLNSGTAELSVFTENGITQYETGKTYPVTVSISDPGLVRFGFQVVALRNSDHSNAGSIKLTEPQRTQIIEGYEALSDRKYVTYTYPGTDAVSTGLGRWTFNWTAPETNEGPVTFYVASIAANNDGTDSGDHSYTKQLRLDSPETRCSIFPTVSAGEFNLGQGIESICVYNASGEKVYTALSPKNALDLSANPPGVYFVSLKGDGKTEYKKIIISR
jgi:hypothetical protein